LPVKQTPQKITIPLECFAR